MQSSATHSVTPDFRDDPMLVALLRKAITVVGLTLPDFDDPTLEALMTSYREAKGERTRDVRFSVAKQELDAHSARFRSQYSEVLGSCLYSQLDRMQGREAAWPSLEADAPELVPDSVIERRLAIDELTRLIDVDADEGVRTFDVLVCKALGRVPTTIRENPLRPAVFFHALGMCWTQAAESDRDELLILRKYAPAIAGRVVSVYPMMTAMLREGLGIPKPGSASLIQRRAEADGKLYARTLGAKVVKSEASSALDDEIGAIGGSAIGGGAIARAASGDGERTNASNSNAVSGRRGSAGEALSAPASVAQAQAICERVGTLFEPTLGDDRLPMEVRLAISKMQLPLARTLLADPTMLAAADHPLRRLMRDLMNPNGWQRLANGPEVLQAIVMHLSVITEMLKRDRRDPARDALLYEHLRSQFLALRSAPPPRLVVEEEEVAESAEEVDESES